MIQIVKSHFQPENYEVLWIDLSVNPALLKIFRSDGWTSIGVNNEVVSSIIKRLEEQDSNISNLNKTINTEVKPDINNINNKSEQISQTLLQHTDNSKIHVPSGGTKGQLLQSNGDDTTTWVNIDLLDILTYGVSWKPNVGDPDLTRIGNPILHRTLPIQSGIKGCIAQCKTDSGKPQIMYRLDENDWRFRKIPEILYSQELIVSNDVYTIVNSVFSTNRYLKQYIKINNVIA